MSTKKFKPLEAADTENPKFDYRQRIRKELPYLREEAEWLVLSKTIRKMQRRLRFHMWIQKTFKI